MTIKKNMKTKNIDKLGSKMSSPYENVSSKIHIKTKYKTIKKVQFNAS